MIGAIVGDIVGSVYEWNNIKTEEFPLFQDKCFFTDDTVMTIAIAEALMNGGKRDDFIDAMKKYGRMYPKAGYGGRFWDWLFSNNRESYYSWATAPPCGRRRWAGGLTVWRKHKDFPSRILTGFMIPSKGFIGRRIS